MINLIHVQERLVGGTKTITQGLGEEIFWSLGTIRGLIVYKEDVSPLIHLT